MLGVLAFSFTLPMTKIAVRSLEPVFAAIGRAGLAGILALIALAIVRPPRPSRAQLGGLAVVLIGVVVGFPLLTAYALRHVPSNHGAIVIGLLPLATAGVAVVRAGERPSMAYWLCSLTGVVAVSAYALATGGGSFHLADLLLILAVLAAAVGYAEGALLARAMPGWQVICWALVLALPVTMPIAALTSSGLESASTGELLAFAYTAMFSMLVGFFLWYAGLARVGIARGGQLQLAQPALSLVWAWPLLGESLTAGAVATAGVVLASVALGRRTAVRATR
jgi:drug/metabolite transporter (DMT)-like permease